MKKCYIAPQDYTKPADDSRSFSIFLAGGITGCPDWQSEIIGLIEEPKNFDLNLLSPRRPFAPEDIEQQIKWEFLHLRKADCIAFWFPCETLCPITLYELGAAGLLCNLKMRTADDTPTLLVGCHPKYTRKDDIDIQMRLARPDVEVVYSLADLANQINLAMQRRDAQLEMRR